MKWSILSASLFAIGCSSSSTAINTMDYVELERMMGSWFVIASIPTFIEKGAHNAVEHYELRQDKSIDTTFTFRQGGFDGKEKQYNPTAFVEDRETNARWSMQFLWPFRADYRIVYVDAEYSRVVIAREARDYAWIMSRTSQLGADEYAELVSKLADCGYDTSKLQLVPQRWPAE